jgi:hypothetical protein
MSEMLKKAKADKGPFDVTRKIQLAPAATEKLQDAVQQLTAIETIIDAHVDRHGQLRISYDASSAGIRDIEVLLDKAGVARASGFWWRLKSAWYRFLDENAKSNARSGSGACCNRPPSAPHGSGDTRKVRWEVPHGRRKCISRMYLQKLWCECRREIMSARQRRCAVRELFSRYGWSCTRMGGERNALCVLD